MAHHVRFGVWLGGFKEPDLAYKRDPATGAPTGPLIASLCAAFKLLTPSHAPSAETHVKYIKQWGAEAATLSSHGAAVGQLAPRVVLLPVLPRNPSRASEPGRSFRPGGQRQSSLS
jgi:hypothetical protein